MTTYKIGEHGTCYPENTPDNLVKVLETLLHSGRRVMIQFGDLQTGKVAYQERGTIGRSTGINKIPLLVKTKRSLGGAALWTEQILRIVEVSTKTELYRNPSYNG
ncbi:MAG TPA: hypothetical protein V6C65_02345 [Allocoleopsis sp.]